MIAIVCPRCERRGSVPESKVNVKLHCPKCNVGFYVDSVGRIHLGEPPSAAASRQAASTAVKKERDLTVERIDFALGDSWRAMPLWERRAIPIVGLIAVGLLVYWLAFSKQTPLPTAIDQRAQMVGTAFLRNDPSVLKRLSASGTGGNAVEWFNQVRSLLTAQWDPATLTALATPGMSNDVNDQRFMLTFVPASASLQAGTGRKIKGPELWFQASGNFEIATIWTRDNAEQWWLDGAGTLKLLNESEIARTPVAAEAEK